MKVVSYTALHYGTDYLGFAIRSVIDHVDEHYVFYSDVGSHGHRTERPNPDSRNDLLRIAQAAAGDKLRWYEGRWDYEGQQRDSIFRYAPDADVILVVDADEIWPKAYAKAGAQIFTSANEIGAFCYRGYRLPMIHFWRSFNKAILHDPAYPVRIIIPSMPRGEGAFTTYRPDRPEDREVVALCHMGYAQRSELVEYKQHVHGHKGEWRKDDWFNTVFMVNAQNNCHPVGSEYWNPEPVNPWDYLPDFMKDHPYANLEVIP